MKYEYSCLVSGPRKRINPQWRANRLRMLRLERRLSQAHLARELNISQGTYSNFEMAYYEPDDKTKKRIARLLKVDVEALIASPEAVSA